MTATEEAPSGPERAAPGAASSGGAAVAVTVGPGAGDGAPPASSSHHPFLAWWPVILFALTVAFLAGGSFWQTRANASAINEIKTDVKMLLREHREARSRSGP